MPFFLVPWCDLLLGKISLVISVEAAECRSLPTWLGDVPCGQAGGISEAGCDGGAVGELCLADCEFRC